MKPTLRIAKLSEIEQDPNNANRHTERGRNMVERSLRERGFFRPMAAAGKGVEQPVMLAGNLTQETAVSIGMDEAIIVESDGTRPIVHVRTDIEPGSPQAILLGLEDNRSAQVSLDFDPAILQGFSTKVDLTPLWNDEELQEQFKDVTLTGGAQVEDVEPQIDKAEELREKWQTDVGQIWQLGRHTIACLDCLDPDSVQKVMNGQTANMVWADPPYGISIVATNVSVGGGEAYDIPFGGVKNKGLGSTDRAKPFGSHGNGSVGGERTQKQQGVVFDGIRRSEKVVDVGKYAPVIGDETTETAENATALYLSLFPKAIHFWWGANYYANVLPTSSCWIVWDKENTGNFADAELAWCSDKSAVRIFRHMWNGLMKDSEKGVRRVHPTQKPIALAKWAFEKYGNEDDLILDPFLGSGMSLIAAEQLGNRRVIGLELSPEYIAINLERYADFTGKQPQLLS